MGTKISAVYGNIINYKKEFDELVIALKKLDYSVIFSRDIQGNLTMLDEEFITDADLIVICNPNELEIKDLSIIIKCARENDIDLVNSDVILTKLNESNYENNIVLNLVYNSLDKNYNKYCQFLISLYSKIFKNDRIDKLEDAIVECMCDGDYEKSLILEDMLDNEKLEVYNEHFKSYNINISAISKPKLLSKLNYLFLEANVIVMEKMI